MDEMSNGSVGRKKRVLPVLDLADREPADGAFTEEHRKRLVSLAEGWECAARLSDEIVKAFQPEVDAFTGSRVGDGVAHDMRLIHAVLSERSQRDTFKRDAEALRALLSVAPQGASQVQHGTADTQLAEQARGQPNQKVST